MKKLLVLSAVVVFSPFAQAADVAAGKATAAAVCAACHGADGNSVASINPNLAGQGAEYITRQLQHFKSGIRANPTMSAMVATTKITSRGPTRGRS